MSAPLDLQYVGLTALVSGIYEKPVYDFSARLTELGVPIVPDMVIDDAGGIVAHFGGLCVMPYATWHQDSNDDELLIVPDVVEFYDREGGAGAGSRPIVATAGSRGANPGSPSRRPGADPGSRLTRRATRPEALQSPGPASAPEGAASSRMPVEINSSISASSYFSSERAISRV